ncbi:Uncharacterised protein [Streptococcus pneumoniae]|nr:Uncharacterised protein [Streptococcus pneumoniae]CVZ89678.1 Uncharacterised protein [Streptococcus pneumoniae]
MIELIKEFGMAILWIGAITTQSTLIMWLISQLGCKKGKLTQSLKKPNLGRGCMNW